MTAVLLAVGFAVAAAVGGACRWALGRALPQSGGWPLGTLAANVAGCFAAGLAHALSGPLRTVLVVGLLGGLTTLSTLVAEVLTLRRAGRARLAGAYLLVSLSAGLAAVVAGRLLVG